jgi:hypothetical protein
MGANEKMEGKWGMPKGPRKSVCVGLVMRRTARKQGAVHDLREDLSKRGRKTLEVGGESEGGRGEELSQ